MTDGVQGLAVSKAIAQDTARLWTMAEDLPREDSFADWQAHLETDTRGRSEHRQGLPAVVVPGLTLLCHPDPKRVGEVAALPSLGKGQEALLSRHEPHFATPGAALGRPLADPRISRRPLRLTPLPDGGVRLSSADSRTHLEVEGRPVDGVREISADRLERGVPLLLGERTALLLHNMQPTVMRPRDFGLIGESLAMVTLRREIERVADLDLPVLLRGESGTGKELVARAIQRAGARRRRPFLSINMGAVPASLAAAELFGAAKGAFSGADRRRSGYFQQADGGTLFLDEIGEMPLEVQVLLLRALETGEIQPVGDAALRRVEVRVLAATDSDLERAIVEGTFKAPLLHRLSGYEIVLPPLRRRRDDIGRLFFHFLRQELRKIGAEDRLADPGPYGRSWVPANLVARLVAYPWPGNVRQLRNVALQLAVASRGSPHLCVPPRVRDLFSVPDPVPVPRAETPPEPAYREPSDISEEELREILRANRWRLQPTARQLGISRSSLYALIEGSSRIRKARDLSRAEIEDCSRACGGRLERMVEVFEVSKQGLKMRMKELGLR